MRAVKILLVLGILVLAAAAGAAAREGYIVRFAGASIHPTGDLSLDESDSIPLGDGTTLEERIQATVEADSAFGFCIDFERRFNDRFGLGFTVMRAEHDIAMSGRGSVTVRDDATNAVLVQVSESLDMPLGDVDMTPILVGANFHFGGSEKLDLYAGPFIGLIDFGDLTFEGERLAFKDEFAWGATLGLDVPFGQGGGAFSAAARYMIAGAEVDEVDSDTMEIDPLVVMFGLGYRF